MPETKLLETAVMSPATFLQHWQGHRRLSRRVIEAFPEDQLFTFSVGGMRNFGELAWEMHGVADYMLTGFATDTWAKPEWGAPQKDRAVLLAAWDDLTTRMDAQLPGVPSARYAENKPLFWGTMPAHAAMIYAVDNEIHHRGQGYVYLRALGITPPPFYER